MREIPALLFFLRLSPWSSKMACVEPPVLTRRAIWFLWVGHRSHGRQLGFTFTLEPEKAAERGETPWKSIRRAELTLSSDFAYFDSDCKPLIQSLWFPQKKQANSLGCRRCFLFISWGQGFRHTSVWGCLISNHKLCLPSPGYSW